MSDTGYQAGMYYNVKAHCLTAVNPKNSDGEPCPQYDPTGEKIRDYTEIHSNTGELRIQCSPCGQDMEIVEAVLMDPQPEPV
jgi:hypothetical protein